jgi:hypothetical protein
MKVRVVGWQPGTRVRLDLIQSFADVVQSLLHFSFGRVLFEIVDADIASDKDKKKYCLQGEPEKVF